jgi:hypothetical protein
VPEQARGAGEQRRTSHQRTTVAPTCEREGEPTRSADRLAG